MITEADIRSDMARFPCPNYPAERQRAIWSYLYDTMGPRSYLYDSVGERETFYRNISGMFLSSERTMVAISTHPKRAAIYLRAHRLRMASLDSVRGSLPPLRDSTVMRAMSSAQRGGAYPEAVRWLASLIG